MNWISLNGKLTTAGKPALLVSNRSYRYGDGIFETMKVINKRIVLVSFHFERLFGGLSLLKMEIPTLFKAEKLESAILDLCKKSKCENLARVRLSAFRGNGGLYDEDRGLQYIIECWPVNESVNRLNENGLLIDVYPTARKSMDPFSNLKSANFLPYSMAALHAKENKLNDCLVLNSAGRIADATIANIFILKEKLIITPALSEGCVGGVMRKWLVRKMLDAGYRIRENPVTIEDLENAEEVFLTNAMNGIRWVKQFRDKTFSNKKTAEIYRHFIKTIWE